MSNPALAALDAKIASQFKATGWADDATFRRRNTATLLPCTVEVDDAVQFFGDQSQVVDTKTTVTAYYADIGQPKPAHGDVFVVGTRTFKVDSLAADSDESAAVCIVTEQA